MAFKHLKTRFNTKNIRRNENIFYFFILDRNARAMRSANKWVRQYKNGTINLHLNQIEPQRHVVNFRSLT